MSGIVQGFQDGCKAYSDSLPKDILQSAAISFLASFTVSTILTGGNFVLGATLGGLGAAASVIDSLIRPIIVKGLGDCNDNGIGFFLVRSVVVFSLLALAAPMVGLTVSVGACIASSVVITGLLTGCEFKQNPHKANPYLLFGVQ